MPLKGEYEPSTMQFVRDQVELYDSSGGTEGTMLQNLPVVILATLGVKSGKIRKSSLMRVEHDSSYAVVASMGEPRLRRQRTNHRSTIRQLVAHRTNHGTHRP